MKIIYTFDEIPKTFSKSLFLAGPTPRKDTSLTWRKEALSILEKLNYDGVVFVPELFTNEKKHLLNTRDCTAWELEACKCSDVILFWIPRQIRPDFEMAALTTNVEFGMYKDTYKVVAGCPPEAKKNEYLKIVSPNVDWYDTLEDTIITAINKIGQGVKRSNAERYVPSDIFSSSQFQDWYASQLSSGNSLEDLTMKFNFFMPKAKKLFMTIFQPSVFILEENRKKENVFVIARSDMSYICAYHKSNDYEIVLTKEFRSPVRNTKSFIYELPGGSSLNPNDDELETASHEFEEEVGLKLPANRFKKIMSRQSSATLCSHIITLFSVELNSDEINYIKNDKSMHGVVEDTEQIYLEVKTFADILNDNLCDWTNIGMIIQGIKK